MHQTGEAFQPGRWAVNFIPVCKSRSPILPLLNLVTLFASKMDPGLVPGAGFQKWARESRKLFFEVTRQPFYDLKNEMVCSVPVCTRELIMHAA